jgi:hypothetical protein
VLGQVGAGRRLAVVAIPDQKWGEGAEGVRDAEARTGPDRRGADRTLPDEAARLQGAERRSSSGTCRRPRRAGSRSSSCATASGRAATAGSTDRGTSSPAEPGLSLQSTDLTA